jgi:hypothetical protein
MNWVQVTAKLEWAHTLKAKEALSSLFDSLHATHLKILASTYRRTKTVYFGAFSFLVATSGLTGSGHGHCVSFLQLQLRLARAASHSDNVLCPLIFPRVFTVETGFSKGEISVHKDMRTAACSCSWTPRTRRDCFDRIWSAAIRQCSACTKIMILEHSSVSWTHSSTSRSVDSIPTPAAL